MEKTYAILKTEDIKKLTCDNSVIYKHCFVKFKIIKNNNLGLVRNITHLPFTQQELIPDENDYYILHDGYTQGGNIYLRFGNVSNNVNSYWYIRSNTSGVIHFHSDPNRYDVIEMEIFKYITFDIENKLFNFYKRKMLNIRKGISKKYSKRLQILPVEIVEKIIAFYPITFSEL